MQDRAERRNGSLLMNQIDDEARPLNDTSDHRTSAEELVEVPG